jgi:hypothetical protein
MHDKIFGLRVHGRDHGQGDPNCPGCEAIDNKPFPRPHKEFGTSCLGLVHAERLTNNRNEVKKVLV